MAARSAMCVWQSDGGRMDAAGRSDGGGHAKDYSPLGHVLKEGG